MNENLVLTMIPLSILLSIIKIIFLKKKGVKVIQVDKYPVLNMIIYRMNIYVTFSIYITRQEGIYKVTEVLVWIITAITIFYFIKNIIEGRKDFDSWILIVLILILSPFIMFPLWLLAMCYLFIMIPINIYMIGKYRVSRMY